MATLGHPGYASWKFNKTRMLRILDTLVPNLPGAAEALQADCLIVHGTSGVWMAGLLVVLQDLPVVLVRKPDERSHGYEVEGPEGQELHRGLVIDDTVCSGRTIKRIADILDCHANGIEVVGVATYLAGGWGDDIRVNGRPIPVRENARDFPVYQDTPTIGPTYIELDYIQKMPPRGYASDISNMPAWGAKNKPSFLLAAMMQRVSRVAS